METIESSFSKIGSRVRVESLPNGRRFNVSPVDRNLAGVDPSRLRVNIARDSKGEFFHISAHKSIDLQVMNMDRASGHLLLFARDRGNAKYRYLCGQDERGLFAAAIPGAVSSVAAAMETLKPETVIQKQNGLSIKKRNKRRNKAFRRQGEWYFIPSPDMNPESRLILRNEPVRRGRSRPHIVEEVFRRGGETVYVCRNYPNGLEEKAYKDLVQKDPRAIRLGWTIMRRNMDIYGRGKVMHPDHRTIVLDGWHKIVPNRETEAWFIETLVFLD